MKYSLKKKLKLILANKTLFTMSDHDESMVKVFRHTPTHTVGQNKQKKLSSLFM